MMRYLEILFCLLLALPINAHAQAQSYADDILDYREGYKTGLLKGRHPLKQPDTAYVQYYNVDAAYRVTAYFVMVTGTRPFPVRMAHGGQGRSVREYGYIYFNLGSASLKLYVYRFLDMENNPELSDRLFIPFTDRTNYKETFHGRRYLDLSANDIKNNKVTLDFNKCYNPHTAYEKGFPYIIPPEKNSLHIEIKAGEKIFGHNPGY
jgi:uncharacterized protein (DUF1684 family)